MAIHRAITEKEDHRKICDFLERVYIKNKNLHNWLPARWEYTLHFTNPLYQYTKAIDWEDTIHIWEEDGMIVGVVNKEGNENVFIQVDWDYEHIVNEMITWAEEHLALNNELGGTEKKIRVWSHENDINKNEYLRHRGYTRGKNFEYLRWQPLERELPDSELPEGYEIVSLKDGIEVSEKRDIIEKVLESPGLPIEIFKEMERAPLYRKELDLVVINDERKLVSYCTIWFDERSRVGIYEPIGTDPDFQKKGVGEAMIIEGLNRLKDLGAKMAYVDTSRSTSSGLYESTGFSNYHGFYPWNKAFEFITDPDTGERFEVVLEEVVE